MRPLDEDDEDLTGLYLCPLLAVVMASFSSACCKESISSSNSLMSGSALDSSVLPQKGHAVFIDQCVVLEVIMRGSCRSIDLARNEPISHFQSLAKIG